MCAEYINSILMCVLNTVINVFYHSLHGTSILCYGWQYVDKTVRGKIGSLLSAKDTDKSLAFTYWQIIH